MTRDRAAMPTDNVSACFAFGVATIRVICDAGTLHWLEEFLAPSFECTPATAAPCTAVLVVDSARFAAYRDAAIASGETVDAFAHDSGPVRLAACHPSVAQHVLYDARLQVCYRIEAGAIEVIAPADIAAPRFALMRVVRELAMNAARGDGGLLLHAAALAIGDQGIAIAGAKAAGKTSLLTWCLRGGAQFVTNDRILVETEPAPRLRGIPTVVTIRDATLDLLPELAQPLLDSGYDHRRTLAEGLGLAPTARGRGLPIDLTPAQFCAWLNVPRRRACSLDAVVFPYVTDVGDHLRVQRLSVAAASDHLMRAVFARGQRAAPVFADLAGAPPAAHSERACRALAARVPCFTCTVGPRSYHTARQAGLFAELLGTHAAAALPAVDA